jgi:acylphosphatase
MMASTASAGATGGEKRLHAIVEGRVQGVSFRYYTVRRARDLGLGGFVRNQADGKVEVVAEGSRAKLDELLSFLRSGPRAAFVTGVDTKWPAPTGEFDSFEVRY